MPSKALTRATQDAAAIAASAIPPGTIAAFFKASAPSGWVKANGSTIGSASSGASRANADTAALFAVLWADTSLAILTSAGGASTRGANATADFAANKRLTLPDLRGEFLRGHDDSRGVDSGRGLATAQSGDIAPHSHTASTSVTSASAGTPSGTLDSQGAHTHTSPGTTANDFVRTGASSGVTATVTATSSAGAHTHTFTGTAMAAHGHTATTTVDNSTGTETRPRNVAALYAIKL